MARKEKTKSSRRVLAAGFAAVVIALALLFAGGPAGSGNGGASGGGGIGIEQKQETKQLASSVPQNESADYYVKRESELQRRLSDNEQNSTAHKEISLVYWQLHKRIPTGGFNESALYSERRAAELRAMGK